jgi:hypothetical protein
MYLAEKGYAVTGVDMSEVGINKMNAEAARRRLEITGVVADLSTFDMSTPVTAYPFSARYMALRPSPSARHSTFFPAAPSFCASASICSLRKSFGVVPYAHPSSAYLPART